ncbi:MAG: SirB2 family protein [Clostridia bacterium]
MILAKSIHVTCVLLSLAGFATRGALMLAGSPLLERRIVRVAPHVVDTALLASALWLCFLIGQYPFRDSWLTAKVLGLVAYIGFGAIALRRGRTLAVRATAFALAIASAAYIVSVALTHDPRGALAWI